MELRIESRPDHLLVVVAGTWDLREARGAVQAIVKACDQAKCSRVLVDGRRIAEAISIADRYELATLLANMGQGQVRMAIVMSSINMFTKTFEDTALNRGVPLRSTDSMNEAYEFLQLPNPAAPGDPVKA